MNNFYLATLLALASCATTLDAEQSPPAPDATNAELAAFTASVAPPLPPDGCGACERDLTGCQYQYCCATICLPLYGCHTTCTHPRCGACSSSPG